MGTKPHWHALSPAYDAGMLNPQRSPTETARRRAFLRAIGFTAMGLTLPVTAGLAAEKKTGASKEAGEKAEEQISPEEDLMREHGVLKRVLLIYREALRRLDGAQDLNPQLLSHSAGIIRSFIEDYHEKLEENYLFPRFEKANQLVPLVITLRQQHQAGRRLTDTTLRLATPTAFQDPAQRSQLTQSLQQFIRMYEPHEAREDTVLFPAFRQVVSPREHDALGDVFENQENKLFGENGFEKTVDKVATIEKALGIYDLNFFTPRV